MGLEECLKKLQYHWFWGLRKCAETSESTLWQQVQSWQAHPVQAEDARQQQMKIAHKSGFKRFFYWLFNIKNYAENYYKLNAYDQVCAALKEDVDMKSHGDRERGPSDNSNQVPKQEEDFQEACASSEESHAGSSDVPRVPGFEADASDSSKNTTKPQDRFASFNFQNSFRVEKKPGSRSDVDQQSSHAAGSSGSKDTSPDKAPGMFSRAWDSVCKKCSQWSWSKSRTHEKKETSKIEGEAPQSTEDSTRSTAELKKSLPITAEMQSALTTLGIPYVLGVALHFTIVKKAYYQKALKAHPDKHLLEEDKKQAEIEFKAIVDAYGTLDKMFNGTILESSQSNGAVWHACDELERGLEKLNRDWSELGLSFKELGLSWKEIRLHFEELEIGHRAMREDSERLLEEIQEVQRIAQEQNAQLAEIVQLLDEREKQQEQAPEVITGERTAPQSEGRDAHAAEALKKSLPMTDDIKPALVGDGCLTEALVLQPPVFRASPVANTAPPEVAAYCTPTGI